MRTRPGRGHRTPCLPRRSGRGSRGCPAGRPGATPGHRRSSATWCAAGGSPRISVRSLAFGDSGGVDYAANRWLPVVVPPGEQSLHRVARSDVEGHGIDGNTTHLQRADGGDLVAHVRVVGVAVPVAPRRQRRAPGENQTTRTAVREPGGHQQTERTHATGDEVRRIGPTPQRLSHRLAGDWRHAGAEELAVAQRQDGLRRRPQHRRQAPVTNELDRGAAGRSTRPPHSCGCSARMTPAIPHSELWRTAASELPSRTPRVTIHSVAGWSSSRCGQLADEIGHLRRQPDRDSRGRSRRATGPGSAT